jgi:hypothetical protein
MTSQLWIGEWLLRMGVTEPNELEAKRASGGGTLICLFFSLLTMLLCVGALLPATLYLTAVMEQLRPYLTSRIQRDTTTFISALFEILGPRFEPERVGVRVNSYTWFPSDDFVEYAGQYNSVPDLPETALVYVVSLVHVRTPSVTDSTAGILTLLTVLLFADPSDPF